jgi:hypothetical protein
LHEEERACPAACYLFGEADKSGAIAWTTNIEESATVNAIDNSVRINFFNSPDECAVPGQPVATGTGVGQATASVNLAASVNMDVLFSAEGEENYETLTVTINDVEAVQKQLKAQRPFATFNRLVKVTTCLLAAIRS